MGAVKEALCHPHWEQDLSAQREHERFTQAMLDLTKRLKDTPPSLQHHLIEHMHEWCVDHITFLEINRP
jgi:hypothetical protein